MLTGQDLRYYEVGEPRARGVIIVRDIKRVRPLTPRGQFEIAALSGRTYLLMAASDKERAAWMAAINDAQFSPSLLARLLRQVEDLEISGLIDLEVSQQRFAVRFFDCTRPHSLAGQARIPKKAFVRS